MKTDRQRILPIAIVALFLVTTLPATFAAPVTPEQDADLSASIANSGGNSAGETLNEAPGDWITKNELHKWYLRDSTPTLSYKQDTSTSGVHQSYILHHPVGDAGPTTETLDMTWGTIAADVIMYDLFAELYFTATFEHEVYVQFLRNGEPYGDPAVMRVGGGDATASTVPEFGSPGSLVVEVGLARQYNTHVSFGTGLQFVAGDEIGVRIDRSGLDIFNPLAEADTLELWYEDPPVLSLIGFTADSARFKLWTENQDGIVTDNFPPADVSSKDERTVRVRLAHVNALGEKALEAHHHRLQIQDSVGTLYFDACFGQSSDLADPELNSLCAGAVDATQPWGATQLYPTEAEISTTVNGIDHFRYDVIYPADFEGEDEYFAVITANPTNEPRNDADNTQLWRVASPINIGSTGVSVEIAEFESQTKTVLLNEPTSFRLDVTNLGTPVDDIALIVESPQDGWSASLSSQVLGLGPGASQQVFLSVTPSVFAIAGDSKTITVRAISTISGLTDSVQVTVALTDVPVMGVDLHSSLTALGVAPGQTRTFPLVLSNDGNFRDAFAIATRSSDPEGIPGGWSARTDPAVLELNALSQGNLALTISAPRDAPTGTTFDLVVKATRIDDTSDSASLTIPVRVLLVDRFTSHLLAGVDALGNPLPLETTLANPMTVLLRDEGPADTSSLWDGGSDADVDFDDSVLVRLALVNEGDRDDLIRVIPRWAGVPGTHFDDLDDCDEDDTAASDGLPDGWRFRLFDPEVDPDAGYNSVSRNTPLEGLEIPAVSVPAHSTKFVYGELKWIVPNPYYKGISTGENSLSFLTGECDTAANEVQNSDDFALDILDGLVSDADETAFATGKRDADPSPLVHVALQTFSRNDASQFDTHYVKVEHMQIQGGPLRVLSQKYSTQLSDVLIHLDANELHKKSIDREGDVDGRTATYQLRAVNTGNEMDTLRITVPSEDNDWAFDIPAASVDTSLMFDNDVSAGHDGAGRIAGCEPPSLLPGGDVILECTMGVYDEVAFNLTATAPEGTPFGATEDITVTVTSSDSLPNDATLEGAIQDSVELITRAGGNYAFDIQPRPISGTLQTQVIPGGTVAVPFTVRNLGTENDEISAALANAPSLNSGWDGRFSGATPVLVPGEHSWNGFLIIEAPANATVGGQETFRIRYESLRGPIPDTKFLEIVATVVADDDAIELVGVRDVLIPPGETRSITLRAARTAGSASSVTFSPDPGGLALPAGWSLSYDPAALTDVAFNSEGVASASMSITAAADAIGTSRAVVPIRLTDSFGNVRDSYIVASVESSDFQLELSLGGDVPAIVPGSTVRIPVLVKNNFVTAGAIDLNSLTSPTGWSITPNEAQVRVDPLETHEVFATVRAPATASPGDGVLLVLQAAAGGTVLDTLEIPVSVGVSSLHIAPKGDATRYVAPLDTLRFTATVTNNGTTADHVDLGTVLPAAYRDLVLVDFQPKELVLKPGATKEAAVTVKVPEQIAPGSFVPLVLAVDSKGPFLSQEGRGLLGVQVYDYARLDVDGDLLDEYAIDTNRDLADGFETVREIHSSAGVQTTALDMFAFLSPAAAESKKVNIANDDGSTTEVVQFVVDGDGDGRWDHFLDNNRDGLPDIYWDPDSGVSSRLLTTKDVNDDGIREYFIDVDGDSFLDKWYDVRAGTFGNLIKADIDGDGDVDYIVDLDGDGEPDVNEPVLMVRTGTITRIQEKVDVDGDGKLDIVVDESEEFGADGIPDYFLPNGRGTAVAIVLEDVTGDGVKDWTYDSDGDGKRDSYYDPVTGDSGVIDPQAGFLRAVMDYWYIGALFGLVIVLFGILLAVTRR